MGHTQPSSHQYSSMVTSHTVNFFSLQFQVCFPEHKLRPLLLTDYSKCFTDDGTRLHAWQSGARLA